MYRNFASKAAAFDLSPLRNPGHCVNSESCFSVTCERYYRDNLCRAVIVWDRPKVPGLPLGVYSFSVRLFFLRLVNLAPIRKLRVPLGQPGPNDAEPFHAKLERGAIHSQARGRTVGSREYPSGIFQCRQYMRTFGVFQSLVLASNLARGAAIKVSERNLQHWTG